MSKLVNLALKKRSILSFARKIAKSKQLEIGKKVEEEHEDTIKKVKKDPNRPVEKVEEDIAKDHLKENPNYYVEGCPIVDKEYLLIQASNLRRIRNSILNKIKGGR